MTVRINQLSEFRQIHSQTPASPTRLVASSLSNSNRMDPAVPRSDRVPGIWWRNQNHVIPAKSPIFEFPAVGIEHLPNTLREWYRISIPQSCRPICPVRVAVGHRLSLAFTVVENVVGDPKPGSFRASHRPTLLSRRLRLTAFRTERPPTAPACRLARCSARR